METCDVMRGLACGNLGEGFDFIPIFPFEEGLDQAGAAVAGGRGGLVEGVVGGVARNGDEAAGQRGSVFGAAEVIEGAGEPLFVVRVIVYLIRQNVGADHVGMVHAGAGLLLPGGIVGTLQFGERVAGHVPHVGDSGGRLPAESTGLEGKDGFGLIPQMDAVVVCGVIRHGGENLIQQGIDGLEAGHRSFLTGEPDAPDEEGLGFDVLGIVLDQGLEVLDAVEALLSFVALVVFAVEIFEGGDPLLLTRCGLGFERYGLLDEGAGALFVVHVGHAHAPVGHGAFGVDGGHLAEGALGLIIPEAVKLADALGEELLRVRFFGTDGEVHRIATAGNEHRRLTRPLVESFPIGGVAGVSMGVKRDGKSEGRNDKVAHGENAKTLLGMRNCVQSENKNARRKPPGIREIEREGAYLPYPGSALPFSLMWPVVQRMPRVIRSR